MHGFVRVTGSSLSMAEAVFRQLPISKGARVVDVGFGNLVELATLATIVGETGLVCGVEPSHCKPEIAEQADSTVTLFRCSSQHRSSGNITKSDSLMNDFQPGGGKFSREDLRSNVVLSRFSSEDESLLGIPSDSFPGRNAWPVQRLDLRSLLSDLAGFR